MNKYQKDRKTSIGNTTKQIRWFSLAIGNVPIQPQKSYQPSQPSQPIFRHVPQLPNRRKAATIQKNRAKAQPKTAHAPVAN
jgi:hypothetical protein